MSTGVALSRPSAPGALDLDVVTKSPTTQTMRGRPPRNALDEHRSIISRGHYRYLMVPNG